MDTDVHFLYDLPTDSRLLDNVQLKWTDNQHKLYEGDISFFFNNIILHRSKLHSSKPFFDSLAQPRICSPQMMVTEIKFGKLNSLTANPPECFYPPLAQNLFWPTVCLLLDII